MDKFEKGYFVNSFYSIKKEVLLGRTKVYGAKARSSEELKFLSSQATLSYRIAVATDAKPRVEISWLNLCRGAKEGNCKLTDAIIAFSDLKVPRRLHTCERASP